MSTKSDVLISGDAVQSLMAEAALKVFKATLEGYRSPLEQIVMDAFKVNETTIRQAVYNATRDCVNSPDFGAQLVERITDANRRSGDESIGCSISGNHGVLDGWM